MNRQKMRFCSISMFVVLLLSLATPAFATETREDSRIKTYTADLSANQSGNLIVFFTVTASSTMDTIGANRIVIQHYDGTRWVDEYIFTVKNAPEMQVTQSVRHSAAISYTPLNDGLYRASVTVIAKDASGLSAKPLLSDEVTV